MVVAVVVDRSHRQTACCSVQRHRPAEAVKRIKRNVHILAARVAGADDAGKRTAGEAAVREGIEVNCARISHRVIEAIVAINANRHPVASRIQRHSTAELIGPQPCAARDVPHMLVHGALRVAVTHNPLQGPAREARVREAEEVDSARVGHATRGGGEGHRIAVAVVEVGANRKQPSVTAQGNRTAKLVGGIEQHVDALSAGVEVADEPLKRSAREARILKGEEIDRAGVRGTVAGTAVTERPHCQTVAGRVQRYRATKLVGSLERANGAQVEIDVLVQATRPDIVESDSAGKHATRKVLIAEGVEIDRT